jgi:hypothetical protein
MSVFKTLIGGGEITWREVGDEYGDDTGGGGKIGSSASVKIMSVSHPSKLIPLVPVEEDRSKESGLLTFQSS